MEVEIITCNDYMCKIRFEDNTYKENVYYYHLTKGSVRKPFNRIGEKYVTNEGYIATIIEYNDNNKNLSVRLDNGIIVKGLTYIDIRNGRVKNPKHLSVLGIGYFGEGDYNTNSTIYNINIYNKWSKIISRCYNEKFKDRNPTYKDVTVCEEWHNFQIFAKWMEINWRPHMESFWDLDKDILIKGNKIYSPETCCFVPQEINRLMVIRTLKSSSLPLGVFRDGVGYGAQIRKDGVKYYLGYYKTPEEAFQAYKTLKEEEIKRIANKWKDLIDPKVYEAMINYEVEITD